MASSVSSQRLRLRAGDRLPVARHLLWFAVSCAALLLLPTALHFGQPFWALGAGQLALGYAVGSAYLLYSLVLCLGARLRDGLHLLAALALGGLCLLLPVAMLFLLPGLEFSRLVLLLSAMLAVVLALYPLLVSRSLLLASALALLAALAVAGVRLALHPAAVDAEPRMHLHAAHYILNRDILQPVPTLPLVNGGAIARLGDGFIVATGDGQFHALHWSADGSELLADRLPLSSPLVDRDDFYADKPGSGLQYRVTGLLLEETAEGRKVIVAHQLWDRAGNCFRVAVSSAPLPEANVGSAAAGDPWSRLYETKPCIRQPFDTVETGGKLALTRDGALLLTVGDHGKDGTDARSSPALAQLPKADYGKVLRLDRKGGARVLTSGHRNPQGLLVDRAGRVWVAEHGPAGGDELNLLRPGQNYGWPLVTYGTDYNKSTWPLSPDARNHGEFTEPAFAFVPSIAITQLIQLGGREFPRWEGDLLVGSLRMETLYRVRLRGDRVIYVEPVFLGKPVRDLVEGADGRIYVWSDDETVTVLSRHVGRDVGEELFARCGTCHEPVGKAAAIAPDLRGILGRKVASRPGYSYSEGLRAAGGRWTEQRLSEFLADPQAFAPGTTMGANGVPDEAERAALIGYLKGTAGGG